MPYYTYGDYVYINKKYDTPEEHHIHSILKTHPDIYIISLLKLIYQSLQDLPKLFVDKMINIGSLNMSKICPSCQML